MNPIPLLWVPTFDDILAVSLLERQLEEHISAFLEKSQNESCSNAYNRFVKENPENSRVLVWGDRQSPSAFMRAHKFNQTFYIDRLYVREECRGQNIGAVLMQRGEIMAGQFDCNRTCLSVHRENEGARKFYEHLGYRTLINGPRVLKLFKDIS